MWSTGHKPTKKKPLSVTEHIFFHIQSKKSVASLIFIHQSKCPLGQITNLILFENKSKRNY